MRWSKGAALVVIVILTASYVYSSIKRTQLSNQVREAEETACAKNGTTSCDLIAKYHDECFDLSYRAEFRVKSFRFGEYRACIENKIGEHLRSERR